MSERPEPERAAERPPAAAAASEGPPEPGASAPAAVPFHRLDPAFVPATRFGSLFALVLLGVFAGSFLGLLPHANSDVDPEQLRWMRAAGLGLWLLLALRAWFWPRLVYARTRYRLGDAALEIRRGVLFHTWKAVPRSRIQHTDVSSGPIQRRYGVATLQVHTAGTTNASIGLSGVSQRTADALRDELMRGLLAREEDGV